MSAQTQRWVMGVMAALLVAVLTGGVAWAQAIHSDVRVLQERTAGVEGMRETLEAVARDVSAIRARSEARDAEIDRRLDRAERAWSR